MNFNAQLAAWERMEENRRSREEEAWEREAEEEERMAEEEAMAEEDPESSEMLDTMDRAIKRINVLTREINRI